MDNIILFTILGILALSLVILVIRSYRNKNTFEELPTVIKQNDILELINVSEQDAAIIMAIISDDTKISIDKLNFKSIILKETELKDVSEQDAAVIMAIISDKTQIKLNELYFKSIKLIQ